MLKLKKISSMFNMIQASTANIGRKYEANLNFGQTSEEIGLSWVGEKCTTQSYKGIYSFQSGLMQII